MTEKIKFDLSIPRMGYFILYRNEGGFRNFFGNGIERTQRSRGFPVEDSRFTHVEVSGGGQWAVAVVPPKSKIVDITKKYKGRYIKIVRHRAESYSIKRYKVAFWASSNCNTYYDWHGVLGFAFKWFKSKVNKYFCSENALYALQKEYFGALGIKPDKCFPAHFLATRFFEEIWEGEIPC